MRTPCPSPSPHPPLCPPTCPSQGGQATIEFVGIMPIFLLVAAVCVQALLMGLTTVFAQAAVAAVGRDSATTVQQLPVPAAWRSEARISVDSGQAQVILRSPSVLPGIASRRLQVRAESAVQP